MGEERTFCASGLRKDFQCLTKLRTLGVLARQPALDPADAARPAFSRSLARAWSSTAPLLVRLCPGVSSRTSARHGSGQCPNHRGGLTTLPWAAQWPVIPGKKIPVPAKTRTFFLWRMACLFAFLSLGFVKNKSLSGDYFLSTWQHWLSVSQQKKSEIRILEHNVGLPSEMQNMRVLYISSRFLFPMAANKTENSNKVSCHRHT